MKGHIQLDGYDYNILNYTKTLADKMATKTGRGSTKYSDQQNWDYWIQEDWSAGLGKVKEEDMGSVFVMGDARRSGKVGLLPYPVPINTYEYERMPMTDSITVGTTGTYSWLSVRISDYTPASDTRIVLRMLVKTPASDVVLDLSLHADTSSSNATPSGSSLATATPTVSASNIPGFQWWEYEWDLSTAKSTADVILITATGSIEIAVGDANTGGTTNWILHDGSSWGTHGNNTPTVYSAGYLDSQAFSGLWVGSYELGLPVWATASLEELGDRNFILWDDDVATGSTSYGTTVEDIVQGAEPILYPIDSYGTDSGFYICYASSNGYLAFYDLSDGTFTYLSGAPKAERVDVGGGYLWRSTNQDVTDGYIYYSADETTWTEIHIGQRVRDIKWWGDFLWFVTNTGLWRIGYGDAPLRTTTMEFSDDVRIEEWANKLYIIDGRDMLEFDGSTIRNISPMAESRLPGFAKGTITAFWGTNSYLYVAVSASSGGRSGVYAYNGNGWSCCFLLGSSVEIVDIISEKSSAYDQADWNIMHVMTATGYYKWSFFDTGSVPEPTIELGGAGEYFSYQPLWIETPWLYGGIKNLDKDWESIGVAVERAVATETGVATSCAYDLSVYYKEGENDAWTLLETNSYSNTDQFTESRFSTLATRPNGLKLKVGILLQPTDNDNTAQFAPYVSASIVKYLAMLRDRWAWNLVLTLTGNQELADGSKDTRTTAAMIEDLEVGVIKETIPIIFRDIDGKQYEVKVNSANMNPDNIKWDKQKKRPSYTAVYNMSIEQVTTTEYTG